MLIRAALVLFALLVFPAAAHGKSSPCDSALWKHVYNRSRLRVIKPCVTVTGRVDRNCRKEKDGDWHCFLSVDPQFLKMLNDMNRKKQHGELVIEPMCVRPPRQKDAKEACNGFSQSFDAIQPGSRVQVTGVFVLDAEHGHNEIHPITAVKIIP